MEIVVSIVGTHFMKCAKHSILMLLQALQALLITLAFMVIVLRCWIRLYLEHRKLNLPDYLVWGGWLCSLGWFICSVIALHIQIDHPLVEPDLTTDSIEYLKVFST
jgi:hypothetical protein